MSRRADPERIYQARRAALRERLISTGMLPDVADRWIAHWEARGHPASPTAWNAGFVWASAFDWITDLHARGLRPDDGKEQNRS